MNMCYNLLPGAMSGMMLYSVIDSHTIVWLCFTMCCHWQSFHCVVVFYSVLKEVVEPFEGRWSRASSLSDSVSSINMWSALEVSMSALTLLLSCAATGVWWLGECVRGGVTVYVCWVALHILYNVLQSSVLLWIIFISTLKRVVYKTSWGELWRMTLNGWSDLPPHSWGRLTVLSLNHQTKSTPCRVEENWWRHFW